VETEIVKPASAALLAALTLSSWPAAAQDAPDAPPEAAPAETQVPALPPALPSLPDRLGEAPGTWDLSRDGTNRRCVMTLVLDSGDAGRRLRFPAGCRRAMPIMNGIAGWLFVNGGVSLVDKNVRPILEFVRRPDKRSLVAKLENGEHYSLVPLDTVGMRPAATEAEPAAATVPAPSPLQAAPLSAELQPSATATTVAPGPAPGLYTLDRFQERDTCRLTLDAAGGGVRVVPGCHDGGLVVFDPVRWRYANGRMTLTAKRGHSIDLVPSGDGRWRRDPEVGTTFVLRRVE